MENTSTKGNNELRLAMHKHGSAIVSMTNSIFTNWVNSLSSEAQKVLLDQHRDNRDFFRKVLQEEYRKEHPNSQRYEDSETKVKKYNEQGKILKEIINSSKN